MKNIVVIGGGTGSFTVLSGLKKYTKNISAVVNMSDSGGSSGILRDEIGVLPPGDVRQCLVALSNSDKLMRDLFNYRFEDGGLKNHSFGNLFLSCLEKVTGSFEKGVVQAAKILAIEGEVIPVTNNKTNLCALLENGQIIRGEKNIDGPSYNRKLKIVKLWLEPAVKATTKSLEAIRQADLIIIGPGNLYRSLLPNLLVRGIASAVVKSKAKKIYVCNLMTEFGSTNNFKVSDFVKIVEQYFGAKALDYVIFNKSRLPNKLLKKYAREKRFPVQIDVIESLNSKRRPKYLGADVANHLTFIRHNPERLARLIMTLSELESALRLMGKKSLK